MLNGVECIIYTFGVDLKSKLEVSCMIATAVFKYSNKWCIVCATLTTFLSCGTKSALNFIHGIIKPKSFHLYSYTVICLSASEPTITSNYRTANSLNIEKPPQNVPTRNSNFPNAHPRHLYPEK